MGLTHPPHPAIPWRLGSWVPGFEGPNTHHTLKQCQCSACLCEGVEGGRRLHTNMGLVHLWGLTGLSGRPAEAEVQKWGFGFWFLVFGFWFLVFGFWFLVFGFWIWDCGFWIVDFGFVVSSF